MVLEFLFPRRCVGCGEKGRYFCGRCRARLRQREVFCPMCDKGAIGGVTHPKCRRRYGMDGLVSIFRYEGLMQQAIKKFKFRLVSDLVAELVELMMEEFERQRWAVEWWGKNKFIVVPVPLHMQRERWRGFNQAEELGRRLAQKLDLGFSERVLERGQKTESQAEIKIELDSKEKAQLKVKSVSEFDYQEKLKQKLREKRLKWREENVRGAFGISNKSSIYQQLQLRGANILLVDDVWTTGATMRECAKVLKRSGGGQVWGMTVAR